MPPTDLVVYGYHGTTATAAQSILSATDPTTRFWSSYNREDWLGDGVYFFQDAPERARLWPTLRYPVHTRGTEAVVIGAKINLERCIDLLDVSSVALFAGRYSRMVRDFRKKKVALPKNNGPARYFDRELVNFVVERSKRTVNAQCVRAAFEEGKPLVPGAALRKYSHVQIVVRPDHQVAIEDVWLEQPKGVQ